MKFSYKYFLWLLLNDFKLFDNLTFGGISFIHNKGPWYEVWRNVKSYTGYL